MASEQVMQYLWDCDENPKRKFQQLPKNGHANSERTRACVAAPTGIKSPRAPKFFCARPRALHFGIA